MANLNERIINELRKTEVHNLSRLINYMNGEKGFFWVRSGGHDHWTNGTAQHSWRVYQYMRYFWEHPEEIDTTKISQPDAIRGLTEKQIILTALLHDVGKIRGNSNHEIKSRDILDEYLGKDFTQRYPQVTAAIFFHHNKDKDGGRLNKHRNCLLRILLNKADGMAAGTAWNSTRCKEQRSQRHDVPKDKKSYRRNALDRTKQMLSYHMYLDFRYDFYYIRSYSSRNILWNVDTNEEIPTNNIDFNRLSITEDGIDFITSAHKRWLDTGVKQKLIVPIKNTAVNEYVRKLRQDSRDEEELLICSNLLLTFYTSKSAHHHRYEYQTRPEIVTQYDQLINGKAVVLNDVTIIRDGESEGYRMVEPWLVDVILIPSA